VIEYFVKDNVEKIWVKFCLLVEDYDDDDEVVGVFKNWYFDCVRYMRVVYYMVMVIFGVIN